MVPTCSSGKRSHLSSAKRSHPQRPTGCMSAQAPHGGETLTGWLPPTQVPFATMRLATFGSKPYERVVETTQYSPLTSAVTFNMPSTHLPFCSAHIQGEPPTYTAKTPSFSPVLARTNNSRPPSGSPSTWSGRGSSVVPFPMLTSSLSIIWLGAKRRCKRSCLGRDIRPIIQSPAGRLVKERGYWVSCGVAGIG